MLSNKNLHVGVFRFTALNPDLGVQIFFVISGFILPYSLWKGRYGIDQYRTFVTKRIIRLDPPYFVAILIALLLQFVTERRTFSIDWVQLVLHVGI